jgi:squalene-hopene/tetraprenyl-beta-curcumene cyclase
MLLTVRLKRPGARVKDDRSPASSPMNTKDLVHFAPREGSPCCSSPRQALAPSYHQLVAVLRPGILRARQYLANQQRNDGTWLGRRVGNASLPSQLIFLLAFRDRHETELARQAAESILWQQLPAGGWSAAPGGAVDVNVSVQAYFALKLVGYAASDERLSSARQRIREQGGVDAADNRTRLFLALLGQVDYAHCRCADERAIAGGRPVPAWWAVVTSRRPVRDVGLERGVRELLINKPCDWPTSTRLARSRRQNDGREIPAGRGADAEQQLRGTPIDTLEFDELVWHAIALETIGTAASDPVRGACEARLRELVVVDRHEGIAEPQPVAAPTVDTAMTIRALRDSGLELDGPLLSVSIEALRNGDWISRARPGELVWCAEALRVPEPTLHLTGDALPPQILMAGDWLADPHRSSCQLVGSQNTYGSVLRRIVERLWAWQQPDGGWASAGTSSAPEMTGAALEALAQHAGRLEGRAVDRGVAWLREAQQADGSWDSTTGVRWIHGTSQAVRGLLAAGVPADDAAMAAGVNWLLAHQQPSGGWGEGLGTAPHEMLYVSNPATATQTAWALLALLAAGQVKHDAVGRGIQFLLDTQQDDGRWDEPQWTLRHTAAGGWHRSELHAVVWPLMAMSRWAVAAAAAQACEPDRIRLRCVAEEASD